MDRSSFDNQMFSWEDYAVDPSEPMTMQFSNVELKVPVGSYSTGTKFPFAVLVGGLSLLILVDEQDNQHGFDLKLSVGEEVQAPEACEVDSSDTSCACGHDHEQAH